MLRDLEREGNPLASQVREVMFNRTAVGVTYYSSAACNKGPCTCYNCTHGTGNATTDCPTDAQHARTVTVYQCVAWINNPFPFGSEFAWDSTGQEEEYIWGRYFGQLSATRETSTPGLAAADSLANLTLTAILAYLPSVPHWAYNGAAWSWGDTSNNAKWSENRRIAGHYRVTLNALPVLQEYFMQPDDLYLLPVAIGAASLHMATIDEDGATSMGFHLDPAILELDPYSGDFGIGFFGHVQMAASVFVLHPAFGALCFLCDATAAATTTTSAATATTSAATATTASPGLSPGLGAPPIYTLIPRDSIRRRVFLEPLGVLVQVEAGRLLQLRLTLQGSGAGAHDNARAQYNASKFTLLLADDGLITRFRVRLSTPSLSRPALKFGVRVLTPGAALVRGAWEVPLSAGVSTLEFGLGGTGAGGAASGTAGHVTRTGNGAGHVTRTGNGAGRDEFLARSGGDEFAALAGQHAVPGASRARRTEHAVPSASSARHCADPEAAAFESASLPDHAKAQTNLVGSPPLAGFEDGLAVRSVDECAAACAAQRATDPKAPGIELHLRCQAWTFALGRFNGRDDGQSWCWLFAGRGNARGNRTTVCGFMSASCDNRPAPPSDWPCCQEGFSCPNPIV